MKRFFCVLIVAVVMAFAERSGLAQESKNLLVPEEYRSPAEAVVAIGGMPEDKFQIIIKPGFYSGHINISGAQFKSKRIRLMGRAWQRTAVKNRFFDNFPILWDDSHSQTIKVDVPGNMTLEIINCVIVNSYHAEAALDPGVLWNNAVIQVAWGASVHLKGNLIISSFGHGVSMSYVDIADFTDNVIIAPRIGIADFNNNTSAHKRYDQGNKIFGAKIGHFSSSATERGSQNEYYGSGIAEVSKNNFCDISDERIIQEFEGELAR